MTDLEYADDMALLSDNWSDLVSMLESLSSCCGKLGLTIHQTVLPPDRPDIQLPQTVQPIQRGESIEVVSSFQYLGSIVQDNCGLDTEVDSRICKASAAFQSLSRILWYQRKIRTSTKVRILNSVILPTLLYGLENTVLLKHHVCRLESFVIRCLRIILGISIRQKKCHTTIRKIAKQQRFSTILAPCCLRFLGHVSQMPDHRLPKQLLVSAPVGGNCAVGGQKRRWNNVVNTDLNRYNLSGGWKEQVQDRESWRTTIKHSAELLNELADLAEKSLKDQKKKRWEMRITESENALHYDHPGCSFQALTQSGLTNHQWQCHSTTQRIQCNFCLQLSHQQGIHNHQRFCQV